MKKIKIKRFKFPGKEGKFFWSDNINGQTREFLKNNLNTRIIDTKIDLYVSTLDNAKDKDEKLNIIILMQQIYSEMLEYCIVLMMSFQYETKLISLIVNNSKPNEIDQFAEKIKRDSRIEIIDGNTAIYGELIRFARHVKNATPGISNLSKERNSEIEFGIFYCLDCILDDFMDKYLRNAYHSIKHGNRGYSSGGKVALIQEDGEEFNVLDSDYSYNHYMIETLNGNNSYIKRVSTHIDSEKLKTRIYITRAMIRYMQYLIKYIHLGYVDYGERDVFIPDIEMVNSGWASIRYDREGHVFDEMSEIKVISNDDGEAVISENIHVKIREAVSYNPH